jgi:uncharacterized protein (TIRG00374 family)
MLQSKKNKSNPLWIALKLLIAVLALWFIYKRVFEKENTEEWWQGAGKAIREGNNPWFFALVFLLMLLNWSIEAVKWKLVMRRLESISFFRSLEAIFSGITISFFTPNRIGEYAGRVFHLRKADRIEATLVTVLENFSQLIITLVFGALSSLIYLQLYSTIPDYLKNAIIVLLLTLASVSLLFFFNIGIVESLFRRLHLSEKWNKYFHVFSFYNNKSLLSLLLLAMLRYFVFSGQFYILLMIFGVKLPYLTAMVLIATTYLVMSVIPTFALSELGVRGAIATFFFAAVTTDLPGVINASFCLWLLNLAFPALIGIFFVFEFRFSRTKT